MLSSFLRLKSSKCADATQTKTLPREHRFYLDACVRAVNCRRRCRASGAIWSSGWPNAPPSLS